MNSKFFVPYETAKKLEAKGYPQYKSDYGYFDNGDSHPLIMFPADNFKYAAPTYHEVLDWLEGKKIYVSVSIDLNFHKREMEYNGYITSYVGEWSSEEFSTREEALNAAIIKA